MTAKHLKNKNNCDKCGIKIGEIKGKKYPIWWIFYKGEVLCSNCHNK